MSEVNERAKLWDERFKESYNATKPLKEQMMKWYQKYNGQLEVKRKGKSNLFINYTLPTIDSLVARVIQTIFNQKPYVTVVPTNIENISVPNDDGTVTEFNKYMENAKNMEQTIEDQLDRKIKIVKKFYNLLRDSFNYGLGVAVMEWKTKKKKVKTKQAKSFLGIKVSEVEIEEEKVIYNAPDITVYDVFNYFWDTKGEELDQQRFNIFRSYMSIEELKKLQQQGKFKDIDEVEESYDNDVEDIKQLKQEARGLNTDNTSSINSKKKVEILYCTDLIENKIEVLANRKHIILEDSAEDFYIFPVGWHPMTDEYVGKSLTEIMEALQDELNTKRNQRTDNINIILNKVFKRLRGANIDPNQLQLEPGGIIDLDNMNELEELQMTDVTANAYQEEQTIKSDIQYITGVDYTQRGVQGIKQETATENANRVNSSGYIFNVIINLIVTDTLIPMYRAMIELNQRHIQDNEIIMVNGQPTEISPDMIEGEFELQPANPNFELPASKETKRADFSQVFDRVTSNPAVLPYIDVRKMLEKLFEMYDIKDIDGIIQTPPPPQMAQPQPTATDINEASAVPDMANMGGALVE